MNISHIVILISFFIIQPILMGGLLRLTIRDDDSVVDYLSKNKFYDLINYMYGLNIGIENGIRFDNRAVLVILIINMFIIYTFNLLFTMNLMNTSDDKYLNAILMFIWVLIISPIIYSVILFSKIKNSEDIIGISQNPDEAYIDILLYSFYSMYGIDNNIIIVNKDIKIISNIWYVYCKLFMLIIFIYIGVSESTFDNSINTNEILRIFSKTVGL